MTDIPHYERLADAAYEAMYHAPTRSAANSHYGTAFRYLSQAIDLAELQGLPAEAARLAQRLERFRAVLQG